MDSVTQFVLGAAVVGATVGGRTAAWRAVLWGGVVATLPDLDVLFDHGDAVQNMIRHRAESHALCWLSLAAPWLAAGIAWLHGELAHFRRWWLAVWLALVTHALLDALTIYGTRLLLPFDAHPFAVGCLFVIDPLYTLPLLAGTVALVVGRGGERARRWNRRGLWLSTGYAVWALLAQQWARSAVTAALVAQGVATTDVVVTPAPLQTILWRAVAIDGDAAWEAFWSPFDREPPRLERIPRRPELLAAAEAAGIESAVGLLRFSGGCCKAERRGDELRVTDLRMGQEPHYVFTFVVARWRDGELQPVLPSLRDGARIDFGPGIAWLWSRMWGGHVPTPR
jgi:inner membrane protein